MSRHSLNQGLVKFFIKDRDETKKMALILPHSKSRGTFKGILRTKYRRNMFFLSLGRNDCLGYGFSTN